MEKENNYFQEAIKSYLDRRAQEDAQFATSYAKQGKTIEECCKFIIQEVSKTSRCGFADNEIYGLAVHYYDEDNIGKVSDTMCKIVVNRHIELSEEQKDKLRKDAEEQYKRDVIANIKKKEEEAKRKSLEKAKAAAEKAASIPSLFD